MAVRPFPRATPGQAVSLDGAVWNRVADILERFDNFSVAAPLELGGGPGSLVISLRPLRWTVPLIVRSFGGGGKYFCSRGFPKRLIPETGTLSITDDFDYGSAVDAMLINRPENGRLTNRIAVGAQVWGNWTEASSSPSHYPVYELDYGKSIRDFRMRADGTCIEATTEDSDNPTVWVCKIDLTDCATNPTTFPAERVTTSDGQTVESVLSTHEQIAAVAFEAIATFGTLPITEIME